MWLPLPWETLRLSSLKPPVSPHRCALPCRRWATAGTQCLQRGLPFDWFIDCAHQYQEWAGVQQTPVPALSLSLWPPNALPGAGQDKDLEKMEFRVCVCWGRGAGDIHPSIRPTRAASSLAPHCSLSLRPGVWTDEGQSVRRGKREQSPSEPSFPLSRASGVSAQWRTLPSCRPGVYVALLQRQSRWLPVRYALRLRKGSSATPSLCLFCA